MEEHPLDRVRGTGAVSRQITDKDLRKVYCTHFRQANLLLVLLKIAVE